MIEINLKNTRLFGFNTHIFASNDVFTINGIETDNKITSIFLNIISFINKRTGKSINLFKKKNLNIKAKISRQIVTSVPLRFAETE